MSTGHPGFDDLSAYHDGEAPEWAAHVAGCAPCRNRLDDLARLTALIGDDTVVGDTVGGDDVVGDDVPAAADSGGVTDDPVSRAVAGTRTVAGDRPAPPPIEPRRWWVGASVAAVLLITVSMGALVAGLFDRPATTTAVGPGAGGAEARSDAAQATADTVITAGELGEIADRAALVAQVRADLDAARRLAQEQAAPAADAPVSAPSVPEDTSAEENTGPPGTPQGSVPCEAVARGGPGNRGPVIYQATAERDGVPAVVLGFGPPPGSEAVIVEARARSDCRLLLQGAIL